MRGRSGGDGGMIGWWSWVVDRWWRASSSEISNHAMILAVHHRRVRSFGHGNPVWSTSSVLLRFAV